ncbi:MAG: hypothetical protein AB8B86_08470 [Pseudomonadales bacterium]
MNKSLHRLMTVVLIACLSSTTVLGSGGGGGIGSRGGLGGSDQSSRPIDQVYEYGKSIITGRHTDYRKLKVCIVHSDSQEKVKLKRKTAKAYKESSADLFANSLYICDKPEVLLRTELAHNDLLSALYYLNKRYALKLR